MITTPVLIVGGGPVGLALSVMLSKLGVRSMLVNERLQTTTHPKLDVVNGRSMEVLRQFGLADAVRAAGNPRQANQHVAVAASASGPFYTVLSDRHPIYRSADDANALARDCQDGSLPLETMQRIAQMQLEPVLLEAARAEPEARVEFGWSLFGFEQDEAGVTAMIQGPEGRSRQVRCLYLIGCDGPSSRVRQFLNFDYEDTRDLVGELFIAHFRSEALAATFLKHEPYWHTWLLRPQFSGLVVSPDASRSDFVLHRPFAPRDGETVQNVIAAAIGRDIPFELVQSGAWRPQFLVANSYGRGRVFIAGDAAHQYMPTGGLGMNTGLLEAHNLAWKLAACVSGWGGPRLMSSYEAERLPAARRNRDHVKENAASVFESLFDIPDQLLDPGPAGGQARTVVAGTFVAKVTRLYESMGIELGYRYEDSPLIVGAGAGGAPCDPASYQPVAVPGARLPNGWRSDGQSLLDQLDRRGLTLVCLGARADQTTAFIDAAKDKGVPMTLLEVPEAHLASLYGWRWLLLRPDQHIAWAGDELPSEPAPLIDRVRGAT
ncbi:MAG: FAD-dependent monooxygenase [Paucibacter sp.]|nr:FAD-dependent monooxygenase [Roseateles sp.]